MDLSAFRELAGATGPFATVYLDVSHDTAQAAKEVELRWQQARGELLAQGVDPSTLAVLDRALAAAPPAVGRAGRALVAGRGQLWLDEPMRVPPPLPVTRYGALPHLGPLLAGRTPGVAHVVAVVDRVGADLRGYDADGTLVTTPEVEGERHPVHKVGGGGLAHRKIQQRVEHTWHANAKQTADEIDRIARLVNAGLVVLAGDVQARAEVHGTLPPHSARLTVEVSGTSRAEDDNEDLTEAVDALVAQIAAAQERETGERFAQELNRPGGHAVSGLPAVTEALRMSIVDTLLLDPETEQSVWVGAGPTELGVDRQELRDFGVTDPHREPADAALVRAGAATGAGLQLTRGLPGGVGALLRA